jgi:hypothetical protein
MNSLVEFWKNVALVEPPFIHPLDNEKCGHWPEFKDRSALNLEQFIESDHFPGDRGFHLSLSPVPFIGDLTKADIFILLLNPGFSISSYESMENPYYRALLVRNQHQEFMDVEFPFMSLDPNLASAAGFIWWHAKFAKIIKFVANVESISYLAAMKRLSRRVAAIELIPYRSKSFSAHRLTKVLPSANAARQFVQGELVERARRGEATIIVTRKAKEWGLTKAKAKEWGLTEADVVIYEGGHTRGAHLGPNTKGGAAILKRLGLKPPA